jgi:hypothetical protein
MRPTLTLAPAALPADVDADGSEQEINLSSDQTRSAVSHDMLR